MTPTPEKICTVPYNGTLYTLSNVSFVVEGSGVVTAIIKDIIKDVIICTLSHNLGKDGIHVFDCTDFEHLHTDNTAFELCMNAGEGTTVKVRAVEFNM